MAFHREDFSADAFFFDFNALILNGMNLSDVTVSLCRPLPLQDFFVSASWLNDLMTSCLVTGFPYQYVDKPNGPVQVLEQFVRRATPVRRLGSAAIDLCWVAAGRFDGYYEHSLKAWDSAAGFLLVEEAGGKVTDFSGAYYSPYQPSIVATNGKIHDELLLAVNGKWEPREMS